MMIDWKKIICRRLERRKGDNVMVDTDRTKMIESAKKSRKEVEEKIDHMIAQLNGCGDRWFLIPKETIDECYPKSSKEENHHG